MLPKDALTKTMVRQAIDALNAVSASLERLKAEMQALAAQLPEYPVVMAMHGVGDSLGPQLMAELGDVARFTHRNAITAFAEMCIRDRYYWLKTEQQQAVWE